MADLLDVPAQAQAETGMALMIERLAANPNVDVDKLRQILDMQERIIDRNAKAAFDEAFSRMWPELPEIDERGAIKNKDGSIKSRYSKYEDIQSAIRPVLKQFGFAMRHRTEWPPEKPNIIRIVGILSGYGHSEESAFEAPPDKNDYRSAIQDQGSTISYGKRYTTCDLLNIVTRGVDTDGQKKPSSVIEAPTGYQAFIEGLEDAAVEGLTALESTFKAGTLQQRNYLTNHDGALKARLKAKAGAR